MNLDCLSGAITHNTDDQQAKREREKKKKEKAFSLSTILKFIKWFLRFHINLQMILTSFPCFCRNSISCCVKVVIEIDFTLWGGFKPRLKEEASSI